MFIIQASFIKLLVYQKVYVNKRMILENQFKQGDTVIKK